MDAKRIETRYLKLILLMLWAGVFAAALVFYVRAGIPLADYPELIQNWVRGYGVWGGVVYVLIYLIRPLLFVPATLLTTVSGLVFGPLWGIFYTIVGENLSANLTYLLGRFLGRDMMRWMTSKASRLAQMESLFRDNGFISVFLMRLSHLPFDLVGYLAGACGLRHIDFALGTFLGILPGLVTFVLLGASFSDPRNLLLVAGSLLLAIAITRKLRSREQQR